LRSGISIVDTIHSRVASSHANSRSSALALIRVFIDSLAERSSRLAGKSILDHLQHRQDVAVGRTAELVVRGSR
jgi:hypothetical protein